MPELLDSVKVSFSFTARPAPVAADMRPAWRLGLLLILLDKCHGASATLKQLHVMNWAARTPSGRSTFLRVLKGNASPLDVIVRYDPTLSRSVDLAMGLDLVSLIRTGRIRLTEHGREVLGGVQSLSVFEAERAFLAGIPGKISHALVEQMLEQA